MSKLHVEESGAGPLVVLLHSSGFSGRQWKKLASTLSSQFHVVVPDFIGQGRTPPHERFHFREDVEAIVALLRAHASEASKARVVGHSYGGFIALQAARIVPELVKNVVVYEPVALGALDPVRDADARSVLEGARDTWAQHDDEAWLQGFVDFWGGAGAWGALREEARVEFRRTARAVRQGVTTIAVDPTPASAYAALDVTLLTGSNSPPSAQRVVHRLHEAIAGSRMHVVENAAHFGPVTHADKVNALIVDALR